MLGTGIVVLDLTSHANNQQDAHVGWERGSFAVSYCGDFRVGR